MTEEMRKRPEGIGAGRKPGPGGETTLARRAFITGAVTWGINRFLPRERLSKLSPGFVDVIDVFEPLLRSGLTGGLVYAAFQASRTEKSSRTEIKVDHEAVEAHIHAAHAALRGFLTEKGPEIFERGTDEDIGTVLTLSAELTAWMEAIGETPLDIRSHFDAYPAVQLRLKPGKQETVDGLSVGTLEDPDSVNIEGSGGYGNGVVVRGKSGRLYMVTCEHVAQSLRNKEQWVLHPQSASGFDLAVQPLSDRPEWQRRAIDISSVGQAIPGTLNYLMSINGRSKGMPSGELQCMGIALPSNDHVASYMLRHASVQDKFPIETAPIGKSLEVMRDLVFKKVKGDAEYEQFMHEATQRYSPKLSNKSTMMILPPYTVSRAKWSRSQAAQGSSGAPLFAMGPDGKPVLNGIFSTAVAMTNDLPKEPVTYDTALFVGGQHIVDLINVVDAGYRLPEKRSS